MLNTFEIPTTIYYNRENQNNFDFETEYFNNLLHEASQI